MRTRTLVYGAFLVGVASRPDLDAATAVCSFRNEFPRAIGQQAYLLATVSAGFVLETVDAAEYPLAAKVRAQLMKVEDVVGYMADDVREGMQKHGGQVAFVRYGNDPSCRPVPVMDGPLDSAGKHGVYVGSPRPKQQWINGRPTFDVYRAWFYPLPAGFIQQESYRRKDTTGVMSAPELIELYRGLWAESAASGIPAAESRVKAWIARHPALARKRPASDLANQMLLDVTQAWAMTHRVPSAGTYRLSVSVAGVDSFTTFGRTDPTIAFWKGAPILDEATGVPIAVTPQEFVVSMRVASELSRLVPWGTADACSFRISVDALPIRVDADSTWTGTMSPMGLLDCSRSREVQERVTQLQEMAGTVPVTFRRSVDGRVTFETVIRRDGVPLTRVAGERLSTAVFGSPR